MRGKRLSADGSGQLGQGVVEFALMAPVMLILLAAVVEIGLVANDVLTLGYGSREGARAGSALGHGGATDCDSGDDPAGVDQTVIAAVQRIVESSGSGVTLADITEIYIFEANASGAKVSGHVNKWRYTGPDSGPDVDPGDGVSRLDFSQVSLTWPACTRVDSGPTRDILGVEVVYDRKLTSPLASLISTFGVQPAITLSETTVMTLNPSI